MEKVTSKFKRNFGIEQKFYSPNRLNLGMSKMRIAECRTLSTDKMRNTYIGAEKQSRNNGKC